MNRALILATLAAFGLSHAMAGQELPEVDVLRTIVTEELMASCHEWKPEATSIECLTDPNLLPEKSGKELPGSDLDIEAAEGHAGSAMD